MKKIFALAAAIAMMAGSTAVFADAPDVTKTLVLKFETQTQTLFQFDLLDVNSAAIPSNTVDKGFFTPTGDGSEIEFKDMSVDVKNNQGYNFTLKADFTDFSSPYGVDNVLGLYAWTYVDPAFAAGLNDLTIYRPSATNEGPANPISAAGDVLIYQGTDSHVKIGLGVGTYVPADAQGGQYTAAVTFTLATA